jgi:transposase
MMEQKYCGVDVSAARLDSFVVTDTGEGIFKSFKNTPEGIEQLRLFALEHGADMVVMEASGVVGRLAYGLLWQSDMPCALVNPASVRSFAKSMGYLEKTDRIDSEMVTRFAGAKKLVAQLPPSPAQQRLADYYTRLRQVTQDIIVQKQRLHSAVEDFARQGIQEVLRVLKRQSDKLCGEIASMIDDDPLWQALAAEFTTYKGVAEKTVAVILANLPEIGTLTNRAISKMVGVAPLADDSGKRQGYRQIRGGRESVRRILFLVGDHVAKHHPDFANFKARLIAKGKAKMQIRIALAHKLLVRLNAKARDIRANFCATA